ncbi:unnamed protein product, partial [Discosporangium mesarthrocarpum]
MLNYNPPLNHVPTHQGKYEEAEPLYRETVASGEKTLDPDHPDLDTDLNNLGRVAGTLVYFDPKFPLQSCSHEKQQVLRLFRKAIATDEEALGPDHPGLATALSN